MNTLIIELPDELAARLTEASTRRQLPPEEIVRLSLDRALPPPELPAGGPSLYDLMKDAIGCIDSGVTDLSTNPKYMEGYGLSRSQRLAK
jgi:hypothetical protein